MSCSLALLCVSLLLPAADADSVVRRYVKLVEGNYAPEGKLTRSETDDGLVYALEMTRGKETMSLTLHYDRKNRLRTAEVVQETGKEKKTAAVQVLNDKQTVLEREGIKEIRKTDGIPVLAAGPSWSPVLDLVRRYDRRKGGKQEFTGLRIGFPPDKQLDKTLYTIEYLGDYKDKNDKPLIFKGRALTLEFFKVFLNDREYLVYSDTEGHALKFGLNRADAATWVQEGYEEALQNVRPWATPREPGN